ncbi:MAG: hypothetical protein GY750_16940, partial [Lentisphaerae bacterium]|nr:hypothetical protein [Lentisphaerota bacterium]
GRFNKTGSYQYHAVDHPPYFIAGLRGEVTTDSPSSAPEDQIIPQARTHPVRTKQYGPLVGASITNLTRISANSYSLEYVVKNRKNYVNYSWDQNGRYKFVYIDANNNKTTEFFDKNARLRNQPPIRKSNRGQRKYCGDGICDNTESRARCPADCS